MTKFSDFIRAPGTAGPPTREGILALGFALRSEITAELSNFVRVDEAQTFSAIEQEQGRENIDAQQFSASLTSLAWLTTAADRLAYTTAANTWAVTTLTAFGRSLIDDANSAAARTTLGLGNVDNTSDANKPVSTATQTALNLKADLASPPLTGTPTAPTATAGTNTTQIATTAFVTTAVAGSSVFTKGYLSAEQTITSGGALTLAHGLGVDPKLITCHLVCKVAAAGFSVGEKVELYLMNDNGAQINGAVFWKDATNVYLRFTNAATAYTIGSKTGGLRTGLTNSDWRLVVGAYA